MRLVIFIVFFLFIFFHPKSVHAIIPPDFFANINLGFSQIFPFIFVLSSTFLIAFRNLLKKSFFLIVFFLIIILFLSGGTAYFTFRYIQNKQAFYYWQKNFKEYATFDTPSKKETYQKNKKVINQFITQLDPRYQLWMKDVVITMTDDLNHYLQKTNKPPLVLSPIVLVNTQNLRKMLNSDSKPILLDVRDNYESSFIQLSGTMTVRLGNLINNQLPLDKNQKIVVICHTDARSFITANYLVNQGFKNVYSYSGGLMQWMEDNMPYKATGRFKYIYEQLPKLTSQQTTIIKQNNLSAELLFTSYSQSAKSLNSLYMSDMELSNYVNNLDLTKNYYINCTAHTYCFDAVSFWYKTKDRISIVGYTGFSPVNK